MGTFHQLGGVNNLADGFLYLGYDSGSSGTYSLSGGSLYTAFSYIGCFGFGSFTQTGGTNSALYFELGVYGGGSGAYNLSSSGLLSAQYEYLGEEGTATFTQSGGINRCSVLDLAPTPAAAARTA